MNSQIDLKAIDAINLKTPLYRKVDNKLYKLLIESIAEQIIANDGIDVETHLATLHNDANAAQMTANTAVSLANTAKTTANVAQGVANTANQTATEAKTTANSAATLANTAKTSVDAISETLGSFYPKTGGDLNGPVNLVNPANSAIRHNFPFNRESFPADGYYHATDLSYDAAGKNLGGMELVMLPGGNTLFLRSYVPAAESLFAFINMNASAEGVPFIQCTPTREFYAPDIATAKYVIDRFKQKHSGQKVFVGGDNASDTLDLYNGRGLGSGLPFATLQAALNWAADAYDSASEIEFIVTGVQHISSLPNLKKVTIKSGSSGKAEIYPDNDLCVGTILRLENVHIPCGNHRIVAFNHVTVPSVIILGDDVTFSGSAKILDINGSLSQLHITGTGIWFNGLNAESAISLSNGAYLNGWGSASFGFSGSFSIAVLNMDTYARGVLTSTLSGAPTGKRYNLLAMAQLYTGGKGINYIPGTIAGTTDSTSQYL